MSVEQVRWGVLGAAKIAREWLCPAIHNSEAGHIAAIASRTPGRGEALASSYGDVRIHAGYDELLADPEVDAVYVPLPNGVHAEWTERCLEAGKHVLCEKPIALKAGGIDRLIDVRDRTGLVAAEAFMVVHHPQWRRVRDILASGELGELRRVQGAFSFFNDDPGNIRNQAGLGGGALRDIGVYPSVTTRFATGKEPKEIRCAITWDSGIDASAAVWADFDGFTLDFYVSMRMAARQSMVFHGTDGFVELTAPFNPPLYGEAMLRVRGNDGNVRFERFPMVNHYVQQIDAFNDAVLTGAPFPCTLEFSKRNQAMIDRIYAAAG